MAVRCLVCAGGSDRRVGLDTGVLSMMRLEVGRFQYYRPHGKTMRVNQELSPTQLDFVLGLLSHHGRCPDCVSAVEVSEGGCTIEPIERRHKCECSP